MNIILEGKALDSKERLAWESACRQTRTDYKIYEDYYIKGNFTEIYDPQDEEVFAFGSIGFIQNVYKKTSWRIFPEKTEIYKCSHYYNELYPYLLNKDYSMLPFGNFRLMKDILYNRHGDNNHIFIRPDSPNKIFCGGVVDSENLESDLTSLATEHVYDYDICLVSSPKNIQREWRLICSDRVVQFSLYKEKGQLKTRNECPREVVVFAEEIIKKYQPDQYFSLDIAETNGTIQVIEVGGFSCAGLYSCDRISIIEDLKYAKKSDN